MNILIKQSQSQHSKSLLCFNVDQFVVLSSGDVLLISDREADELLEWELEKRHESIATRLNHISYSCNEQLNSLMNVQDVLMSNNILGRIQLFNGETMFGSKARCLEIKQILSTKNARAAIIAFVGNRGLDLYLPGSELIKICEEE